MLRVLLFADLASAQSAERPGESEVDIGLNDFGVGGVLDVPSARVPKEGVLSVTLSRKDVADFYAVSFQVMPRLEMSFRYSIFGARQASASCFFNCDRSFEAKYLLLSEGEVVPAVSVGARDLLGTGNWSSEYLAANKRFGNLDLSVGVGWGRLAERSITSNPLTRLDDGFAVREGSSSLGGQFSIKSYFRGPDIGAFGSLRYSIPQWKIDLLAAYNSDSYAREVALGAIPSADPISAGIEWQPTPGLRVAASWQQGNSLAFRISASADTLADPKRKAPNGFGSNPFKFTNVRAVSDSEAWWTRFVNDAEASGLLVFEAEIRDEKNLVVRYRNNAYRLEADAIRRLLTLAELYAPPELTEIIVTGTVVDYTTHSVRYERGSLSALPVLQDVARLQIIAPVELERQDFATLFPRPDYAINFSAGPRFYIFDPDFPLIAVPVGRVGGEINFGGGWRLTGSYSAYLSGSFDRIRRGGETALPPVRTLQRNYLQQGDRGIDNLTLTKRGKLRSDVFYQAFGGLLEEMYAGVGGEVLWRPYDSRLALGLSVQAVRQREFERGFGLLDYQTVTGHLSGYWATPFYNLDVAVHAGRYLAGDVGATLEVQKRMPGGWMIGAWATLTNVPFEVFGEGSFDKGLFFTMPVDFFSTGNTRERYRTNLRIINRDGGRPVEGNVRTLWDQLRDTQIDSLETYRTRMTPE